MENNLCIECYEGLIYIKKRQLCKTCYNRAYYEGKITEKRRKHGLKNTKIYARWQYMLNRCNNPKNKDYKYYGARGITVCKRWLKVENFYADMGDPPKGLTLERKDNDGNYEPDNCKWATRKEQQNNKRN